MQTMTPAEYRHVVTEPARTMKVATVREAGLAHLAPVWCALDGETIIFTTGSDTLEGRNLRRDLQVSLDVDDEAPPFADVLIEGVASPGDNLGDLLLWATRSGGTCMGAEQADACGRRNGVPGELPVRVAPRQIIARTGIAE